MTYLHFITIAGLFVVLFTEVILLKPKMTKSNLTLIARVDALYGLLSVLVLISGLLRLFYYGKGSTYYLANGIFITKLSVFVCIGLLSTLPTVKFIKLRKEKTEEVLIPQYDLIKKIIYLEIALLIAMPFLAVLMANGIDF